VKTKAGMNVLIDLSVAGGDSGLALIRDFQADPFKRDFTHVDFQAISLTEKLEVEVPVMLTGLSIGVKEGGVVEQLRRTLHVRSLPESIPEKLHKPLIRVAEQCAVKKTIMANPEFIVEVEVR